MRDIRLGRGGRGSRSWLLFRVRRGRLAGAGLGEEEWCRLGGEEPSVMERERVVTGIWVRAIKRPLSNAWLEQSAKGNIYSFVKTECCDKKRSGRRIGHIPTRFEARLHVVCNVHNSHVQRGRERRQPCRNVNVACETTTLK